MPVYYRVLVFLLDTHDVANISTSQLPVLFLSPPSLLLLPEGSHKRRTLPGNQSHVWSRILRRKNTEFNTFSSVNRYLSNLLTLTGTTGSGCLVKTILPSRNGGTMLCTSRCTRATLSSSKSSSRLTAWTTPEVSIRFLSQSSLS